MGVMCTSIIVEDITDNSKSLASDPGASHFHLPCQNSQRDMRTVCGMLYRPLCYSSVVSSV